MSHKYYTHAKNNDNDTPTDMFKDTFISGAFTKHRYNALKGFAN